MRVSHNTVVGCKIKRKTICVTHKIPGPTNLPGPKNGENFRFLFLRIYDAGFQYSELRGLR